MASKVLLFTALVAFTGLVFAQKPCNCGSIFDSLNKAGNDIVGLLGPLLNAAGDVNGCSVQEAKNLGQDLLIKAIKTVSQLGSIPVPPQVTAAPFTLQCNGLKPSVEQFNSFLKALEAANVDSVRCKCRNTALENLLLKLSVLYHHSKRGSFF
ncbi:hypothetical protein L596_000727 [Steinernema carpocapsae]|uniref:Uncharacterized protein n=1 Tax=Steinernema carpocapsae TaxID=34508 RepID=A0A4U8UK98_STECR|nr:hypothetical protein L596_000727 [Steinernema carpocapsae]